MTDDSDPLAGLSEPWYTWPLWTMVGLFVLLVVGMLLLVKGITHVIKRCYSGKKEE